MTLPLDTDLSPARLVAEVPVQRSDDAEPALV
jgi:hypothetical protein